MAHEAYTKRDLTLQDGTKVVLKPVTIKYQKLFVEQWDKVQGIKDQSDYFDILITCAGIGLHRQLEGKVEVEDGNKLVDPDTGELDEKYKEYLEDTLDLETINVVIEITGGLKLTVDPKAVDEMERQAAALAKDGKTSTS